MRARQWQQYLTDQAEQHGKRLFTSSELANVGSLGRSDIALQLHRLLRQGVLVRYARGLYGLPHDVQLMELVPQLDPAAYVTGLSALFQHNLVTQVPAVMTCFTVRRHFKTTVTTPLGRIELTRVSSRVYAKPKNPLMAEPEQALLDYIYISRQRGTEAVSSMVTFRHLERLKQARINAHAPRYPKPVVAEALSQVRPTSVL